MLLKIQSVWSLPASDSEEDFGKRPDFLLRYSVLGPSLGVSGSQAHQAVKRLKDSGLVDGKIRLNKRAATEWLVHGVKYFQPPKFGGVTRGLPTSYAGPPLSAELSPGTELPPVWDFAEGVRGIALEPIYHTVPLAAKRDPILYEYLAILDAIRSGRSREANLASEAMRQRLGES